MYGRRLFGAIEPEVVPASANRHIVVDAIGLGEEMRNEALTGPCWAEYLASTTNQPRVPNEDVALFCQEEFAFDLALVQAVPR